MTACQTIVIAEYGMFGSLSQLPKAKPMLNYQFIRLNSNLDSSSLYESAIPGLLLSLV